MMGHLPSYGSLYEVHYRSSRDGSQFRMSLEEFIYKVLPDSLKPELKKITYDAINKLNKSINDPLMMEKLESELEKKWEHAHALQLGSMGNTMRFDAYAAHMGFVPTSIPLSASATTSPSAAKVQSTVPKDSDIYYLLTS